MPSAEASTRSTTTPSSSSKQETTSSSSSSAAAAATKTPRNTRSSNADGSSSTTTGKAQSSRATHKSSPSLSAFFKSSPSVLWRRGPELESSIGSNGGGEEEDTKTTTRTSSRRMASSVSKRKTSGGGSGGDTGEGKGSSTSASKTGSGRKQQQQQLPRGPLFWQKNYLVAYNLASAVLWAAVLGRVLLLAPVVGPEHVYGVVGEYAKWVQTGALLEVVHSLTGLVRAPLLTTVMQVSSRLLLVWGIVDRHPDETSPSVFYSTMLVAWSVTEVVRYGYFVMNIKGGGRPGAVPRPLTWLRYNTFFVLYPTGIASETALVWKASLAAAERAETLVLWAILAIYVPGSYILFTHMMAQRRKVMRAAGSSVRQRVDSVKSAQYTQ